MGPEEEVTISNISVEGCCTEGSNSPNPGEDCSLRIEWRGHAIHAQTKVVWKTKTGMAGHHFTQIGEQDLDFLRELCSTLDLMPLWQPPNQAKQHP